jgi:Flp pilus assembly protein TadG
LPRKKDRGAAAVEFALVLPLLFALTLGIIAFGHAFHVQTVLDNAARVGVRVLALQDGPNPPAAARQAAIDSARPSVTLRADQITATPTTCTTTVATPVNARVTITLKNFELLGGLGRITLTGTGTMRCNG